jgi:glycosyltransferase involved in cell wall biosynthesis
MQRAAPRSIEALTASYQKNLSEDEYEIIVVENGSSEPLNEKDIIQAGSNVRYFYLDNPPASPAFAINYGVEKSIGEVACIMVDGAHILTPGALSYGLELFSALKNPVVLTPQFFLGEGPQTETIYEGYDEAREDALLGAIGWPADGYRLFEIGVPYRIEPGGIRPKLFWFVRMFESNCMFVRKEAFLSVGGCDERFDIPGGGILLPDLYRQLTRLEDIEIVQLMGEASFHQLHGGVSTNTNRENQKNKWQTYLRQYEEIRGEPYEVSKKGIKYYGHMPSMQARQLMITG